MACSHRPRTQRGVALITALLVVALATTAAVSLTASHQLDLRRTATSQALGQAQLHAQSVEALAAELLATLRDAGPRAREMLDDGCRTPPLTLEMDGALVEAYLEDLHCRLNVNNLADPEDEETEVAFLELVEGLRREHPDMGLNPGAFVENLRAWVDPSVEPAWYSQQEPPYAPGNQLLASASELLMVRGMDLASYRALERYITALPETGTRLNALLAPERLREAYNLPPPEDLDPEAYEPGTYAQLSVTIELDERTYRQCSIINTGTGEIILRRLRAC